MKLICCIVFLIVNCYALCLVESETVVGMLAESHFSNKEEIEALGKEDYVFHAIQVCEDDD